MSVTRDVSTPEKKAYWESLEGFASKAPLWVRDNIRKIAAARYQELENQKKVSNMELSYDEFEKEVTDLLFEELDAESTVNNSVPPTQEPKILTFEDIRNYIKDNLKIDVHVAKSTYGSKLRVCVDLLLEGLIIAYAHTECDLES
jgi:hypothetical protein